jgi:Fuc2NAc and GlcNAc transferase
MLIGYGVSLFLLSVIAVGVYRRYAYTFGALDVANSRSAHKGVIPRGAGLVFVILWLISLLLGYTQNIISLEIILTLAPFILLISILGFCDDRRDLSAGRRLLVQFALAILFIAIHKGMNTWYLFGDAALNIGFVGILLAVFGIVWSVNLFNFMDGSDGQSSIESFYVLGVGGLLYWQYGAIEMALIAWTMVVSVAGYLVWNWPKASVFMGDAGSYCLGFMIVAFAIIGNVRYQIPIGLWLILYAAFWFDATVTLVRRIFLKKHWATPHRDHAYQRLNQAGYTHKQILWGLIGINTILSMLTLWANAHTHHIAICCVMALIFLSIIYFKIERIEPLSTLTV